MARQLFAWLNTVSVQRLVGGVVTSLDASTRPNLAAPCQLRWWEAIQCLLHSTAPCPAAVPWQLAQPAIRSR
jgi:hypothetical protein